MACELNISPVCDTGSLVTFNELLTLVVSIKCQKKTTLPLGLLGFLGKLGLLGSLGFIRDIRVIDLLGLSSGYLGLVRLILSDSGSLLIICRG